MDAQSDPTLDEEVIGDLRDLMEDEFGDLIQNFIDDTDIRISQISEAIDKTNTDDMKKAAHALKSSSGNIGAMKLSRFAEEIERLGFEESIGNALDLIDQARKEYSEVKKILSSELQS